jgi:NAD(P)-dependent dehydrogenase (short-subunit alcohol dehydrogenase family)
MTERVVVITGAAGATGRAAAHAFAARGDRLVLIGRDEASLMDVRRELDYSDECILTVAVDLADLKALKAAAQKVEERFGAAQVLIHLVGGWTGGKTVPETDPADMDSMLRQHVLTTFNLFQAFGPQLERSGWGRLLTVSTPGVTRPAAKRGAYSAAKAAQENLFFTLGEELKEKGVTANIIVVNSIDAARTGKGTPPEEIVDAMLYLCSEEASHVNGTRLQLL